MEAFADYYSECVEAGTFLEIHHGAFGAELWTDILQVDGEMMREFLDWFAAEDIKVKFHNETSPDEICLSGGIGAILAIAAVCAQRYDAFARLYRAGVCLADPLRTVSWFWEPMNDHTALDALEQAEFRESLGGFLISRFVCADDRLCFSEAGGCVQEMEFVEVAGLDYQELIDHDDIRGTLGFFALAKASSSRCWEKVRFLLQNGAGPGDSASVYRLVAHRLYRDLCLKLNDVRVQCRKEQRPFPLVVAAPVNLSFVITFASTGMLQAMLDKIMEDENILRRDSRDDAFDHILGWVLQAVVRRSMEAEMLRRIFEVKASEAAWRIAEFMVGRRSELSLPSQTFSSRLERMIDLVGSLNLPLVRIVRT